MKKMFLSLLLCFASLAMVAQEHMTFKGVPIDGTLDEMVVKLRAKGFYLMSKENGTAIMTGDFAGYKDVQIAVLTMEEVGEVNAVAVLFAERENWSSIENDYNHLKGMLTEKYGEPSRVIEEFQSNHLDKNNFKFIYLTSDRCTWASVFETAKGDIELFMQKIDYSSATVVLKYYDKTNTDAVRSSAMDDL